SWCSAPSGLSPVLSSCPTSCATWTSAEARQSGRAYPGATSARSRTTPWCREEISVTAHAPSKARPVRDAKVKGEKLAQSTGFEWLARAGFVARGLIYGIIGVLALEVAFGAGGQSPNQQGALKTIAQQPFGKVLLILVAIGLAGYALWRLIHVLLGP